MPPGYSNARFALVGASLLVLLAGLMFGSWAHDGGSIWLPVILTFCIWTGSMLGARFVISRRNRN